MATTTSTLNNPFQEAQAFYKRDPGKRTFPEDLVLHLQYGWVVSSPTVFLMGRPVVRGADVALILEPSHKFENPDAWLVWFAAGADPISCLHLMPFYLPYVGWEKNNRLRFYPTRYFTSHAFTPATANRQRPVYSATPAW